MKRITWQPVLASAARIVAEYADKPVLVIGTHFPPPGAGHIVTCDTGVQFRPA